MLVHYVAPFYTRHNCLNLFARIKLDSASRLAPPPPPATVWTGVDTNTMRSSKKKDNRQSQSRRGASSSYVGQSPKVTSRGSRGENNGESPFWNRLLLSPLDGKQVPLSPNTPCNYRATSSKSLPSPSSTTRSAMYRHCPPSQTSTLIWGA